MSSSAIDLDAALATPLETLLSSGGDHRQRIDRSTGLNRYRVSGKPRDGVPFGSSTASWPSDLGFEAAARALALWREHPGGPLEADLDGSLLGLGGHCTAQAIYLRSSAGELLEPAMIDAAVTAAVEAAVNLGATVVIHMVAHSKTGLRAPSVHQVATLVENALAEIEAYHAIPPEHRSHVYHMFAAAMLGTFGPARTVDLIIPTPPVHELASGLGAFPSVFSLVVSDGSGRRLGMDELARLHVGLDMPIESEEPALRRRFHLGQPVALGPPQDEPAGVLRVALGARLVREHADSPDSGAQWFRDRAEELLCKITTLVTESSRCP